MNVFCSDIIVFYMKLKDRAKFCSTRSAFDQKILKIKELKRPV
jgi:hypothetical protein